MTTFTDVEVDTLAKGGNDVSLNVPSTHRRTHTQLLLSCHPTHPQVANQVWLGRWDPKQDREPDKKNPVTFKEYLVAKYERKQWYTEPGEHKEEPKAVATPPTQSKLPGPPKVKNSARCSEE